jgi:hypothetical protein
LGDVTVSGINDYSGLIYIAVGAVAYMAIKRLSDASALSKSAHIIYNRQKHRPARPRCGAAEIALMGDCRRKLAADYMHEAAMLSGKYGLDSERALKGSIVYGYRGYEDACGIKERHVAEILPFNAFDYSDMVGFMHSFCAKGSRLMFLNACRWVVMNDALLR